MLGFVLGSILTTGASPEEVRSVHADCIGVRADQRGRGIGELLLRKVWLAAMRRGFTTAALDVDDRSMAHLLHRRLGYVAVQSTYSYLIGAARGNGAPAFIRR